MWEFAIGGEVGAGTRSAVCHSEDILADPALPVNDLPRFVVFAVLWGGGARGRSDVVIEVDVFRPLVALTLGFILFRCGA